MKIFLSLFQLLPTTLDAIVKLQGVQIPGQSKKQIILHTVDVAAQIGGQIPIPLVQAISLLVDKIVFTLQEPQEEAKSAGQK